MYQVREAPNFMQIGDPPPPVSNMNITVSGDTGGWRDPSGAWCTEDGLVYWIRDTAGPALPEKKKRWECPYCSSQMKEKRMSCKNCGAPRGVVDE